MNPFFLAAAVLMTLAVFAHMAAGTRETLSLRPAEKSDRHDGISQGNKNDHAARQGISSQDDDTERAQRNWTQALCAFQLVSVDLVLIAATIWLLALTDTVPARHEIACFIAGWLGIWGFVWLLQLLALKTSSRNCVLLGQWLLFFLCAVLMGWGAMES